jgi:uncharacterized protein (TIGR04255 family)
MTTRPSDLPDFERPPLNELVLSVQFGDLPFANVHAGIVWQRFANSFPTVEEQPLLEPVFETFGSLRAREPQLSVQLMPMQPSRYWFVSADGTELLQVQRDRLVHNWRQRKPEDRYPHYEPLRAKFEAEIAVAEEVFRELSLGEIACNQCEVSYINLIMFDDGSDPNGRLREIFTIVTEEYSDAYLRTMKMERGRFNCSYVIPGESGKEPIGRLHFDRPRQTSRSDGRKCAFLVGYRGREVGVRAFTSATKKEMHRLWGRIP